MCLFDVFKPLTPELPEPIKAPEPPDPAEEFALSIRPKSRNQLGTGLALGDFFLPSPGHHNG